MENYTRSINIEEEISKNEMILLYFSNSDCGVCLAIKPKLESMLEKYPKIKSLYIDTNKFAELASQHEVFTIPVIILFIDGKLTIREIRNISLINLDEKIERYYQMYF